jgi:hypothetical protein
MFYLANIEPAYLDASVCVRARLKIGRSKSGSGVRILGVCLTAHHINRGQIRYEIM